MPKCGKQYGSAAISTISTKASYGMKTACHVVHFKGLSNPLSSEDTEATRSRNFIKESTYILSHDHIGWKYHSISEHSFIG